MSVTIGMEYSCKCLGIDRAVNPLQLYILRPQISITLSPEVVLFIFDGPDLTRSQFVNNQLVESCQLVTQVVKRETATRTSQICIFNELKQWSLHAMHAPPFVFH